MYYRKCESSDITPHLQEGLRRLRSAKHKNRLVLSSLLKVVKEQLRVGCGRPYNISPPSSIFRALPLLTFKRRLGTASMTKTFSCCSPGKFFTSSQAVFSARLLLFSYGEVTSSTAQSSSVKTRSEGILPAEKKANEEERNTLFCSLHSAYLPAPFANPNIVLTSPLSNKK